MTGFGPTYTKIHSLFKRDMSVKGNPVIEWDWSIPEFEYLQDLAWHWTEKIDGTNTRLHFDGYQVTLGGRTDNAQIPAHLVEAVRNLGLLDVDEWRKKWPTDGSGGHEFNFEHGVTIYGEGYGPKIQKGGGLYRDDVSFIVFDVKVGTTWLRRESIQNIAEGFGLEVVPHWGSLSLRDAWILIKHAELSSKRFPKAPVEGLVGTPAVPLLDRMGRRIIAKVKVKDAEDLKRIRGE